MPRSSTLVRKARNAPRFFQRRYREIFWDYYIAKSQADWNIEVCPGVTAVLPADQALARSFFIYRQYEDNERRFLTSFLKEGDVFVDVGANIGLFSLLASTRVGALGEVHAFEPTPETFETLQRSVSMNRMTNVSLYHMALGDRVGPMNFHVMEGGYAAWNTFASPEGSHSSAGWHDVKVECTTLDLWAERRLKGKPIDLIKIDVEGWERRVLLGGRSVLCAEEAPVLLVEFSSGIASQAHESIADLRETILSFGYQLYEFHFSGIDKPMLIQDKALRSSYKCNLVAAKRPGPLSERTNASIA